MDRAGRSKARWRVRDQCWTGHGLEACRGSVRVQRNITNRHEGLAVDTGLGNPNGIDSKDPHLVENALNHLGGLICRLCKDLKIHLHPALGALLLPLQEVPWDTPQRKVGGQG